MELQMKFGPHSRHMILMGYPDGVKGYRVCNMTNRAFFMARDVIFDETLPPTMVSNSNDFEEELTGMEPDPIPVNPDKEHTHNQPNPTPQLHCSGHTHKLTEKGKVYHENIANAKSHSTKGVLEA